MNNFTFIIFTYFFLFRALCVCFFAFLIFWISWDTAKEPSRLISLVGLLVYIVLGFLFSKRRDRVS